MTEESWIGIGAEALTAAAKGASVGSAVPGIGTVVGGLAGLASSLVPHVFGAAAQPALQAAAQAITGATTEPAQVTALATDSAALLAFKAKALDIAAEEKQTELTALQARLDDTQNARQLELAKLQTGSKLVWLGAFVDVFTLSVFAAVITLLFFVGLPDNGIGHDIAVGLIGTVATLAVTVVNYHRGSSAGSATKEQRLAQLTISKED